MRRGVALPLLVAALIAVAGCGQKDAEPEVASANSGAKTSDTAKKEQKGDQDKFMKCMRENGVDVHIAEGGKGDSGSVSVEAGKPGRATSPKKFEEAHEKCKKYAPVGDGAVQLSEADKKKMLEHARCMRKEGIDMPDPTFEGGMGEAIKIPADEKKFEAALKKCGGGDGASVRIGGGK